MSADDPGSSDPGSEGGAPAAPETRELFSLLGERWNYAILREVFFGVERFGALQRTLGIAPNTLTSRLAGLVELGLLERHRYRPDKEWFDYRLTDSARELVPAWISFSRWAGRNLGADRKPGRGLRHSACGELTSPRLTCSHCGATLNGRDIEPAGVSFSAGCADDEAADAGAGVRLAAGADSRASSRNATSRT